MALAITMAKITMASRVSPRRTEMTVAASRSRMRKFLNWPRKISHGLMRFSSRSAFGPYFSRRRAASSRLRPLEVASSRSSASASDIACQKVCSMEIPRCGFGFTYLAPPPREGRDRFQTHRPGSYEVAAAVHAEHLAGDDNRLDEEENGPGDLIRAAPAAERRELLDRFDLFRAEFRRGEDGAGGDGVHEDLGGEGAGGGQGGGGHAGLGRGGP